MDNELMKSVDVILIDHFIQCKHLLLQRCWLNILQLFFENCQAQGTQD